MLDKWTPKADSTSMGKEKKQKVKPRLLKGFRDYTPEEQIAFEKMLSVVREVMEGIYRKFDRYGVADNRKALQALLDNGLEMVSPDAVEVSEWRTIVNDSHRQMAIDGTFDIELLDRLQELIDDYRSNPAAVAH